MRGCLCILAGSLLLGGVPARAAVPVTALAFSPDGRTLVSNGPRRLDIRSPIDGTLEGQVPIALQKITAVAFSPRNELLAVAGGEAGVNGEVLLIYWPTREVRQRFTNGTDLATALAFNGDGTALGAAFADHLARVWHSVSNGTFLPAFTLSGHAGPVLGIAYSPGGGSVVTASADRSIKVWSPTDGRLLRTFGHHLEAVNAIVFAPAAANEPANPSVCASASSDRTVRIWQPETGRMVRIVRQHRSAVLAVAFAPDGRNLFTAGEEGIVRRFAGDSDVMLSQRSVTPEWIYCLAVSRDGAKVAAGDWAGNVHVFHP